MGIEFVMSGVAVAGVSGLVMWVVWRRRQNTPAEAPIEVAAWARVVASDDKLTALQALDAEDLEDVVAELYERSGNRVERSAAAQSRGVDIYVQNRQGENVVVQCKAGEGLVGQAAVRSLWGVVTSEQADRGVLVTTGRLSRQAREWAEDKPITLYDGRELAKIVWRVARGTAKTGDQMRASVN